MTDTRNLGLPLLQPAQAQKHVTVNEALVRLDALAQAALLSRSATVPPAEAQPGSAYAVPAGATGDWAGAGGQIAVAANGGWEFVEPRRGWRAWIADEHRAALHDGEAWRAEAVALSAGGAVSCFRIVEFDHVLGAGPISTAAGAIPAGVMVFAVAARVVEGISGSLTSWALGSPGSPDRYGSGMGLAAGAYARGLLGAPMAVYADEALLFTAEGGAFAGGTVRVAIHVYEPGLPAA